RPRRSRAPAASPRPRTNPRRRTWPRAPSDARLGSRRPSSLVVLLGRERDDPAVVRRVRRVAAPALAPQTLLPGPVPLEAVPSPAAAAPPRDRRRRVPDLAPRPLPLPRAVQHRQRRIDRV